MIAPFPTGIRSHHAEIPGWCQIAERVRSNWDYLTTYESNDMDYNQKE
ncbi:hypothetical protein TPY_2566 [Sulfobacillus acidophilus TPY]|nr:hypothetical protein TPY_2566 [Sulfobacillus acidophilus TPY]